MTIKPVSAPPSAKRVTGNVDADNKEAQVVVVVEQSVSSQAQVSVHATFYLVFSSLNLHFAFSPAPTESPKAWRSL